MRLPHDPVSSVLTPVFQTLRSQNIPPPATVCNTSCIQVKEPGLYAIVK